MFLQARKSLREHTSGGVLVYQSRRLIKSKHQGGVPFNTSEQSEPSRTRRKGRENSNIYKYVQVFLIRWGEMKTKNITLKVNSELYDKYREICKKEGWIVSRQFEKCMEAELEKRGRENDK